MIFLRTDCTFIFIHFCAPGPAVEDILLGEYLWFNFSFSTSSLDVCQLSRTHSVSKAVLVMSKTWLSSYYIGLNSPVGVLSSPREHLDCGLEPR